MRCLLLQYVDTLVNSMWEHKYLPVCFVHRILRRPPCGLVDNAPRFYIRCSDLKTGKLADVLKLGIKWYYTLY